MEILLYHQPWHILHGKADDGAALLLFAGIFPAALSRARGMSI
jgi:hypothetical protein